MRGGGARGLRSDPILSYAIDLFLHALQKRFNPDLYTVDHGRYNRALRRKEEQPRQRNHRRAEDRKAGEEEVKALGSGIKGQEGKAPRPRSRLNAQPPTHFRSAYVSLVPRRPSRCVVVAGTQAVCFYPLIRLYQPLSIALTSL